MPIKRLCLPILLLICQATNGWCDAHSTTQAGAWGTGSTWVGGVAPVPGDTATISHAVTASASDITIGSNPANDTTPAVTVADDGTLTITGVSFKCQGAMVVQEGGKLTIGPDAHFYLDSDNPTYQYQLYTVTAGIGSAEIEIIGTAGHPAIFDGHAGRTGKYGRINLSNTTTNNLTTNYATIKNLSGGNGGTLVGFVQHIGTGQSSTVSNTVFDTCYQHQVRLSAADSNMVWTSVDIRNAVGIATTYGKFDQLADKTTGTRSITNLTAYEPTLFKNLEFSIQGMSINGLYAHNVGLDLNSTSANVKATGGEWKNIFFTSDVLADGSSFANPLNDADLDIHDFVILTDTSNYHGWFEHNDAGTAIGPNNYYNFLADGANNYNAGASDIVVALGEVVVSKGISIGDGGIFANALAGGSIASVERCTAICDGASVEDTQWIYLGENPGSDATQGKVTRSNLAYNCYRPISAGANLVSQTNWTVDYNGSYLNKDATNYQYPVGHANIPAGTVGPMRASASPAWFNPAQTFGTDNSTHDVYGDPGFTDLTWTVKGYFNASTIQEVGREIVTINGTAYDGTSTTATTKTVATTLLAARTAFTPTNRIYDNTGYNGEDIGAVDFTISTGGFNRKNDPSAKRFF